MMNGKNQAFLIHHFQSVVSSLSAHFNFCIRSVIITSLVLPKFKSNSTKNMKKSIFAVVLMLSVCAGFASSQTKKKVGPGSGNSSSTGGKTTISRKATTVRKITTPRKTTTVRKVTTTRKNMTTQANSLAITTDSGLTYIVTKQGTGAQLKAGDEIIVNYTGLLTNGLKFDSSLDRGEPFSFPLGAGRVIKGWDEGFQKLKVGDHAVLTIPSSIGYSSRGAGGVIPPDATLIFIVEVIGINQSNNDSQTTTPSEKSKSFKSENKTPVIGMNYSDFIKLCGDSDKSSSYESASGKINTYEYKYTPERGAKECYGRFTFTNYILDSIYR
jgi:FKBP-type peptidyl-prolyl cis-trans isomerase